MQFTPQQLTGGPKFQHRVRIGNWSEDLELEDIKLKDYLKKKETGALLVNAKQKQLEESLYRAELSPSPSGALEFGQKIMLFNHQSKGFMAANPYDPVPKAHEAFALTTGPNGNACVRNVLELVRADENDGFDDNVVHYGQNIRCMMAPFSRILQPTYMHSELVTALAAAKFSRHQEVSALARPTGETLWQVLYPDTATRFEMEGEPVPAGSPVVIRHVQTGSFLASDEIPYTNIFGTEFEVHCYPYYSLNKTQNLTSEKKGEITGDYALRRHGLPNIWTIVTGTHGLEEGGTGADMTLMGDQTLQGDATLQYA
mmetsp:Transcript_75681/g.131131  ORF Transcript_75681/g.131131 Transcript_75681/m.131131 type:complete len:314 (-) Transcript_75681:175-1116(-)